jgi:HSP20 family protein
MAFVMHRQGTECFQFSTKEYHMRKDVQVRNNEDQLSNDWFPTFERMIDRFFGDRGFDFGAQSEFARRPMANVKETDKAYILSAEIPGIPKEDIEISVNGNLLTIRAEHSEEKDEGEQQGYRRQYRSFRQSFTLPSTVDSSQVEACCDNGLLEVWIPKTERAQAKKVEVQSGKGSFLDRLMGKSESPSETKSSSSGSAQH